MTQLKNYQSDAVERLEEAFEILLRSSENEICVFQAPTGSGKTLIVSQFLRKIVKGRKDQKKFSFIWVSVRRLHDQSKDKLEKYYENDGLLKCSYFEDLEDKQIDENEILFINWESINRKDKNTIVRENEQDFYLDAVVKNTKEEGREIILVIDESHHTAHSEKSKELIEGIAPKITIEVSATPKLSEEASIKLKIPLSNVKAEGMIKTEIAVNPEFMNLKIGPKNTDDIVIGEALKKRKELAEMYKKEGSDINPLMLIQLPDKKEGMEDKKEIVVNILKDKFNITEENGKLAIWLSEEKSDTLPNIEKKDNEVEVLIFKQAIALGWDCPRASILVIFRESKSFTFTIQTIGRIMRMPELKHYTKEPELNKGFVFTNLANINITEEYAKDYVTVFEAKRKKIYKNISLSSVFLKRQRERTRLSGQFTKIFMDVASEIKLKEKVALRPSKIVSPIIADGRIVNIDKTGEVEHKGTIEIGLTEKELRNRFDNFIRDNCTPFAPVDSSDRMKTALYQFFNKEFKYEKYDPEVQKIILGKENVQVLVDAINLAKEKYRTKIVEQLGERREIQNVPNWEVPVIISYNSRYNKEEKLKSIMKPFYTKKPSEPERLFIEFLENSKKVKWWFKSGENEIKYFAIFYVDELEMGRAFYVDFIVQFEDGSIGLFDTKSGITASEAGSKAEGLQKYIRMGIKKGKKIWGGIVINVNGTWRYNDRTMYYYDPNDLSKWKVLEI